MPRKFVMYLKDKTDLKYILDNDKEISYKVLNKLLNEVNLHFDSDQYYCISNVSKVLGVKSTLIREYIENERLKVIKLGKGIYRIKGEDILEFLGQNYNIELNKPLSEIEVGVRTLEEYQKLDLL